MRMINLNWICINSNKLSQSTSTYLPFNVSSWHTKTFVCDDASGKIMSSTSISLTVFFSFLCYLQKMKCKIFLFSRNQINQTRFQTNTNQITSISFRFQSISYSKNVVCGFMYKGCHAENPRFSFKVYTKNEKYLRISSRYTFLRLMRLHSWNCFCFKLCNTFFICIVIRFQFDVFWVDFIIFNIHLSTC